MLTNLRCGVVAVVLVLAAGRADAQWVASNGTVWNNPMSSLAATMIQGNMNNQAMADAFKKGQGGAPAHQPISATDFRSSGKRIVVEQLAGSIGQTPEQKQQLSRAVLQVVTAFEAKYRKNNVAYALAFMLGSAVLVDKDVSLDDQQMANLSNAMTDRLLANPAFARASATERQTVYETFITIGALTIMFNEAGKTNADAKNVARALAKQTLSIMQSK